MDYLDEPHFGYVDLHLGLGPYTLLQFDLDFLSLYSLSLLQGLHLGHVQLRVLGKFDSLRCEEEVGMGCDSLVSSFTLSKNSS